MQSPVEHSDVNSDANLSTKTSVYRQETVKLDENKSSHGEERRSKKKS